ncbi:DUF1109 domain-containing protein [Paraburkholderia sp. SARCC-3016]|uniref:DUF1109 domain-containing protein n=1 Tax=Paraburkholderia sp. SARCC-3016 TaxID=3058611 RepID=UPI002809A542|nr:DUF1109 domain-containing protein [Paraburkholderia sp. SARCC-3016]MDQ7978529.1 DUF1109 domain-containing protein [Paraburkholderia sp. SARCC-3016]
MNTENLIAVLAADAAPVDRRIVERRMLSALSIAICGAITLLLLSYGVRSDLAWLVSTPVFWAKVAFAACIASAALIATVRLSRPGVAVGRAWAGLVAPAAIVLVVALTVLWFAPRDARAALLMGHTWRTCSLNIAALSVPGFVAILAVVRSLAPTRLRLSGALAGLLAGAIGTAAYCLRCPETSVPFWATWYLLGIAIPTFAGAVLGQKVLRW